MPSNVRAWPRLGAVIVSVIAQWTGAQELRGTVSDSANRHPIAGAVVALLDSGDGTLSRNITDERGQYRLLSTPAAHRLRVVRMGYRPRDLRVPPGTGSLDVAMVAVPSLLEAVRVSAAPRCQRRTEAQAALALLEQVRAGLLTAVVARQTKRADMVRLAFERTFRGGDRLDIQTVRIDSSGGAVGSWRAALPAREFVRGGFLIESEGERMFYGPDADVLLDDAFASGYCFHVRGPDRARPAQVGLAFSPIGRSRGRVDVDGTLWVDTAARQLREIEFRYLGLPAAENDVRPGGRVSFWEMANGVVFVDRWSLRLPIFAYDTTYNTDKAPNVRTFVFARETGGEVASAVWPGGHNYHAPLGTLQVRVVDLQGNPVTAGIIRLVDTDYLASPDERGFAEIRDLLPGPYAAAMMEPSLMPLGIMLPTNFRFAAQRDSVVQGRIAVPDRDLYVRRPCGGTAHGAEDDPWLIARVTTRSGAPVAGAHWELQKETGVDWRRVVETRVTGNDGRVHQCMKLARGDHIALRVWRRGELPTVRLLEIRRRPTVISVDLSNP